MIDNQYSYYQMYSVGGIENIGPGYDFKKDNPLIINRFQRVFYCRVAKG